MHVKISTIEFEVKSTLPGVKSMVARIDEAMQEFKARFSHLRVDGVAVIDAPLDYVKQNRKDIKEVEVIFITEDQKQKKALSGKTATRTEVGTMRVTISNITFDVKKTPPGMKKMFARIDEAMRDFGVYYSHIVVDGEAIFENPKEYVEQELDYINEIEVMFFTAEQYLQQVMGIVDDYLLKALPAMKGVADEFYGRPDDGTWERFSITIEGLQKLVEIINSVISDPAFSSKIGDFTYIGEKIGTELIKLKEAAEWGDMTLVGDIVNYEIVPFVESLHKAVSKLIVRHNPEMH